MMGWNWRRTKKFGPIRLTWHSNLIPSVSFGIGPVRFSRSRKGKITRTIRGPFGLWKRKAIDRG